MSMSDTHKDKHKELRKGHMERRKDSGLTYRQMQEEFGVSKSKIHRDLKEEQDSGD